MTINKIGNNQNKLSIVFIFRDKRYGMLNIRKNTKVNLTV